MSEAIDPDDVPEVLCDGRFNVAVSSNGLAVITFTHDRADASQVFAGNPSPTVRSVVRARVALSMTNLAALRDLLNTMLPADTAKDPAPAARATAVN